MDFFRVCSIGNSPECLERRRWHYCKALRQIAVLLVLLAFCLPCQITAQEPAPKASQAEQQSAQEEASKSEAKENKVAKETTGKSNRVEDSTYPSAAVKKAVAADYDLRQATAALRSNDHVTAQAHLNNFLFQHTQSAAFPYATVLMVQSLMAVDANEEAIGHIDYLVSQNPQCLEAQRLQQVRAQLTKPYLSLDLASSYLPGKSPDVTLRLRNVTDFQLQISSIDLHTALSKCTDLRDLLYMFSPKASTGSLPTAASAKKAPVQTAQATAIDRCIAKALKIPAENDLCLSSAAADRAWDTSLRTLGKNAQELRSLAKPMRTWEAYAYDDMQDHKVHQQVIELPVKEAGAYLLTVQAGDTACTGLVVLSSLGAIPVEGQHNGLGLWFVNKVTGQSVSPRLSIFTAKAPGRQPSCLELTALPNGLVQLPLKAQPYVCLASKNNQYVLYTHKRQASPHQAATATGSEARENYYAYLYLNSLEFVPEETLHYRTIVRVRQRSGLCLPKDKAFNVKLLRPNGQTASEREVTVNDCGVLRGDFTLPTQCQVGIWQLAISVPGQAKPFCQEQFLVRDRSMQALSVQIETNNEYYVGEEAVQCSLAIFDANHSPVPGAAITLTCQATPWQPVLYPEPSVPWYQVQLNAAPSEGSALSQGNKSSHRAPLVLTCHSDNNGRALVTLPLADFSAGSLSAIRLEACARVNTQKQGYGYAQIKVASQPLALTLDVPEQLFVNQEALLTIQAVDLHQKPCAAEVSVAAIDEFEVKDLGKVKTSADAPATLAWKPEYQGNYRLRIITESSKGHKVYCDRLVTVEAAAPASLTLSASKTTLTAGESLKLTVDMPSDRASLLLTLEGLPQACRWVLHPSAKRTTLNIPIPAGAFPGLTVRGSCYYDGICHTATLPVHVINKASLLKITAQPASLPLPGQHGTIKVTVTDQSQQPVAAEVSIGLTSPFKQAQSLAINSPAGVLSDFFNLSIDSKNAELVSWIADARTAENGQAEIPVTWPNTPGLWSLASLALEGQERMGFNRSPLEIKSKVSLAVNAPATLTYSAWGGDKVQCEAILTNETSSSLTVEVNARSSNSKVLRVIRDLHSDSGADKAQFTLQPKQSQSWPITVEATSAGKAELSLDYQGSDLKGSHHSPITIISAPNTMRFSKTVEITKDKTLSLEPVLPASWSNAEHSLDLSLDVGISGVLCAVCDSLLNNGTDAEEIVANCVPQALALQAIKYHALPKPSFEDNLPRLLDASTVELLNLQNADGGFAWKPGLPSDPKVTTFIVYNLQRMRVTGYSKCDQILKKATAYLQRIEPSLEQNFRCFALLTLSHGEGVSPRSLLALTEKRRQLSPAAFYQLIAALHNVGQREKAKLLLTDAKTYLCNTADNSLTYCPGDRSWSDVEATSFALTTLLLVAPQQACIDPCLNWLLQERQAQGWRTKRESTLAASALASLLLKRGESTSSFGFGIWINGIEVESGRISKSNWCLGKHLSFSSAQLPDGPIKIQVLKNSGAKVWLSATETYQEVLAARKKSLSSQTQAQPVTNKPQQQRHSHEAKPDYSKRSQSNRLSRLHTQSSSQLDQYSTSQEAYTFALQRKYYVCQANGSKALLTAKQPVQIGDIIITELTVTSSHDLPYVTIDDSAFAGVEIQVPQLKGIVASLDSAGLHFAIPVVKKGSFSLSWQGTVKETGIFFAEPARIHMQQYPELIAKSALDTITIAPSSSKQ